MASHRRFCAFCRSPRAVYAKKHVGPLDAVLAFAASLLLSYVVWQDFDPRSLVLFALALAIAEMFIIFRWRLSIACPHCGFDPVHYRKSPERAARQVKDFMAERRADPMSAFVAAPKLPVIRKVAQPPAPTSTSSAAQPAKATATKSVPSPARPPQKIAERSGPGAGATR